MTEQPCHPAQAEGAVAGSTTSSQHDEQDSLRLYLGKQENCTLYTGVTTDLQRRVYEHKKHLVEGFTRKYNVTRLVWFQQGDDVTEAISVEKKIKNRPRKWKKLR